MPFPLFEGILALGNCIAFIPVGKFVRTSDGFGNHSDGKCFVFIVALAGGAAVLAPACGASRSGVKALT